MQLNKSELLLLFKTSLEQYQTWDLTLILLLTIKNVLFSLQYCNIGFWKSIWWEDLFLGAKAPLELAHVKNNNKKKMEQEIFW